LAATIVFLATYAVMAIGRVPGLRVDRTGAAIIGAGAMIAAGVLTLEEAYRAINWDTIILLFGMMIVVANLRLSGFFAVVAEWTVERAGAPVTLLAAVVAASGALSAFFVNDTVCIVLTPLVIGIAQALRRNPVPYLLAVAMASNAGSVATITGNPQNMMIGSFSGIPYRAFSAALAPIAAVSLVMTGVAIWFAYRREFASRERLDVLRRRVRVNRPLLWKSVAVTVGMVVCFLLGWPVPQVALIAGAVLLLTRRIKPEKIYDRVDWPLLVMFAGLFVVSAGMEKSGLENELAAIAARSRLDSVWSLSALSAALSNIVSNVPAVLILKPFIRGLSDPANAWLTLAMSSTLAGNLTVVGSVANLIVIQRARGEADIGFWEYTRVGAPLAVATLFAGAWMLSLWR
jgi:Na+/H+ antiporter NhaD/arsenite permease-like protein